jgi:hypothetical protein
MKRFCITILATAALAAAFLAGCEAFLGPGRTAGTGNLVISLGAGGGSRALVPSAETLAGLRYDLALTGPSGQKIATSLTAGEIFNEQVALGDWEIYAEAYDPDNALIGTGNTIVTVKAGMNQARVPMYIVSSGDDIFTGTWISDDNFIRLEASNGSFKQYLVSIGKEVVYGTYTVSGNVVTAKMIQINTLMFDGADVWVAWANLPDAYKEYVGGSETQQVIIIGDTFTSHGKTLIKQNGTGGGNTDPKTLVITGIDEDLADLNGEIQIGIFPPGTSPDQALLLTGIVAGASDSDVTLSGNSAPFTVTVQLRSAPFDFGNLWTGFGTYDIYVIVGSRNDMRYYWRENVLFAAASTVVSKDSFSEVLFPDDDPSNPFVGTWWTEFMMDDVFLSIGLTITEDFTWEMTNSVSGIDYMENVAKGTYACSGNTAEGIITHTWSYMDNRWEEEEIVPFTMSMEGNGLVFHFNEDGISRTLLFTKGSGGGSSVPVSTSVTAVAMSSSSISLRWDSVSGAASYEVFRVDDNYENFDIVASTPNNSYTDTGLLPNTTYYYTVFALNSYGEIVALSYGYAITSIDSAASITLLDDVWHPASLSQIEVQFIYRESSPAYDNL